MARQTLSHRLRLLDEQIHALIRRFYVRPSPDGPGAELSTSELFALSILGRKRRCTMTELARDCGLALSSMTGVVDGLVDRRCGKRTRDEKDRRKVYVELDKKGGKIYQDLLETEMEMIITMMDSLNPKEQDLLLRLLGKAVASLGK